MLIGDMDISRLMVYVQKVEENKVKGREEYRNKKTKTGMILASRKVVQVDHNFKNQRGIHHHLLVHQCLETNVSIVDITHRTSRLDRLSLKLVWHQEVLNLLHVPSVVGITLASVAKVSRVVSSTVRPDIS